MTDSRGQLRRRLLAGAVAVALVVVGVFAGLALGGDDGGGSDDVATDASPTTGDPTTTTAAAVPDETSSTVAGPSVQPTPAGQELIDLVARGQSAAYSARYQTVDPTSQLGTLFVEIWREGDRLRQDATVQVEGRTVESSAFVDGDEVRACQRGTGQQEWQCQDVPRESAPDVDGRIRAAINELADQTAGGTDTTIAGQPARCYEVTDDDGEAYELCVTAEGVPARLVTGNSSVELVSYQPGVPDGIFEPPA